LTARERGHVLLCTDFPDEAAAYFAAAGAEAP
jgi:hypothetical protein